MRFLFNALIGISHSVAVSRQRLAVIIDILFPIFLCFGHGLDVEYALLADQIEIPIDMLGANFEACNFTFDRSYFDVRLSIRLRLA